MDRSLATLLRSLQSSRDHQDAVRLLPAATGLLSRLSNPLNISLLSSQLLANTHLFPRPVQLAACRSIFSVFYTAAIRFTEDARDEKAQFTRSNLTQNEWTKAIIQGADDRSPRWRHLLLLGGLLLGFDANGNSTFDAGMRSTIEAAVIAATNIALQEKDSIDPGSELCVVFVVNTAFPLISDHHRVALDYNILLPELIEATYFSHEGLEHGYWLGTTDQDVIQASKTKFGWSTRSQSANKIREIKSRPLTASLGPLSRLIAHTIESVTDPGLLIPALARLNEFSRNISLSWRRTKLSEIEITEEADCLDDETRRTTMPDLLQLLRNTMFSLIISLRAITGRTLLDAKLSSDAKAPMLAIQTLHILRDLYFISHRFGQLSSSQYLFVNYTAIDILNQFPEQAETFLNSIRSQSTGVVPLHPLDRLNDLFFLNLSEHFTLTIPPQANEELLVNTALPYIKSHGDKRLGELYEAAHSVLLAVFAAPQNGSISIRHVPFYIETLLRSFPSSLTPRQFRLAVKSLMQVSSSTSQMAVSMPELQEIVLDMMRSRLPNASESLLGPSEPELAESSIPVSEMSVLVLTIIENLTYLPVWLLDEWLGIAAESVHKLADARQRIACQRRFWEILSSGDMDVERAALGVAWWTTQGGRELVLFGENGACVPYHMSGALEDDSRL